MVVERRQARIASGRPLRERSGGGSVWQCSERRAGAGGCRFAPSSIPTVKSK